MKSTCTIDPKPGLTSARSEARIIQIDPARVASRLLIVELVLILASTAGQLLRFGLGHDHAFGLVRMFYLDAEANVPTWYSSFLLLLAASLLGLIAADRQQTRRNRQAWAVLSVIFAYLSVDETAIIHESFYQPLNRLLGPTIRDAVVATWVIPGTLALLAFVLLSLRFLQRLPTPTRRGFVLAGAVYVAGALGWEMVGHQHKRFYGVDNPGWSLHVTIEEGLEMGGVILFIHALLRHLERRDQPLTLRIGSSTRPTGIES